MSSVFRNEQPSRSWWSLSKSSNKDLRKHYSSDKPSPTISKSASTRGFPSFASVIGLKSKKHPALTIQDPPSPLQPYSLSRLPHQSSSQSRPDVHTRLQSKPVPQPLSPADSIEPLTPMDGPSEARRSLLTLSDPDPFAGRAIALLSPPGPNSLSTHTNGSFLDINAKSDKPTLFLRSSYSSSSSNPHSPKDPPSHNSLGPPVVPDARTLIPSNATCAESPTIPTSSHSQSQPNSRPSTRSRGMTESSSIRPPLSQEAHSGSRFRRPSSAKSNSSAGHSKILTRPSSAGRPSSAAGATSTARMNLTQSGSVPPATLPRVIIRQGSFQRTVLAPSAPPTHDLPEPPLEVFEAPMLENDTLPTGRGSMSSSSLSFLSSVSSNKDNISSSPQSPQKRGRKKSLDQIPFMNTTKRDPEANTSPGASSSKSCLGLASPRSLKKTISQSSITKRSSPSQTPASPPLEPTAEKAPRKQRSYHRLPIPPLPLGIRHSHTSSTSTPTSPRATEHSQHTSISVEQKHGSIISHSSLPVRRRVFSGSSLGRPSISSGNQPPEDDAHSLFSLRSDQDIFSITSPFKPWPASLSTSSSFWEDNNDQPLQSPVRSDYTPQRIMSPEDLAKVEAGLDDISIMSPLPSIAILPSARERTLSMASTVRSDRDSEILPNIFSSPVSESADHPQTALYGARSMSSATDTVKIPTLPITRALSLITKPSTLPPRLSHRPSTASGATQLASIPSMSTIHEPGALAVSTPSNSAPASPNPVAPLNVNKARRKNSGASNPSILPMKSLPPPPRPRYKAQVVTELPPSKPISNFASERNAIGIDMSHKEGTTHPASNHNNTTAGKYTPRHPPPSFRGPRGTVVQSSFVGMKVNRRSLLRKPSFLDIDDDDVDKDAEVDFGMSLGMNTSGAPQSNMRSESFLEFGRESFDTIRSGEFGPF